MPQEAQRSQKGKDKAENAFPLVFSLFCVFCADCGKTSALFAFPFASLCAFLRPTAFHFAYQTHSRVRSPLVVRYRIRRRDTDWPNAGEKPW